MKKIIFLFGFIFTAIPSVVFASQASISSTLLDRNYPLSDTYVYTVNCDVGNFGVFDSSYQEIMTFDCTSPTLKEFFGAGLGDPSQLYSYLNYQSGCSGSYSEKLNNCVVPGGAGNFYFLPAVRNYFFLLASEIFDGFLVLVTSSAFLIVWLVISLGALFVGIKLLRKYLRH